MNKKLVFLLIPLLLLGSCAHHNGSESGSSGGQGGGDSGSIVPVDDADEYDTWLNSWSEPNHLYFHYNRGSKGGYENYCLWLWQHAPQDLEGALYAFPAERTHVSDKLTLKPMTNHWMTSKEVGKGEDDKKPYIDSYGVIADVDLGAENLIGGKSGTDITFDGMEEIGFLLPQIEKMDGSTNWVSDGGRETYLDDIAADKNWRPLAGGGKAIHIFVSTGALYDYSYYAGSGVAEAVTNPIDLDTTGNYRSDVDAKYSNNLGVSSTSDSFKELGVGYQVFVASFRDSDVDGMTQSLTIPARAMSGSLTPNGALKMKPVALTGEMFITGNTPLTVLKSITIKQIHMIKSLSKRTLKVITHLGIEMANQIITTTASSVVVCQKSTT